MATHRSTRKGTSHRKGMLTDVFSQYTIIAVLCLQPVRKKESETNREWLKLVSLHRLRGMRD